MTSEEMIELRIGILSDLKDVLAGYRGEMVHQLTYNIETRIKSHHLLLEVAANNRSLSEQEGR